VIPEDVASALDVLASRVRRLSRPLARNPHRFHEERSDIAKRHQPRIAPLSEAQPHRHPFGNSPVVKFFEILPR
jgi:hypothetical protein